MFAAEIAFERLAVVGELRIEPADEGVVALGVVGAATGEGRDHQLGLHDAYLDGITLPLAHAGLRRRGRRRKSQYRRQGGSSCLAPQGFPPELESRSLSTSWR